MLFIPDGEVVAALERPLLLSAIEQAFIDLARGVMVNPVPSHMVDENDDTSVHPMVATAINHRLVVTKVLNDSPARAAKGEARQRSSMMVTDLDSGDLVAVLSGGSITAARTAAASAIATKHLARPGSSVLGLIGAGRLAVEHAHFITRVMPGIEEIVVWSRSSGTSARFCDSVSDLGLRVRAVGDPREVCACADIVCTLTPATEPVVRGEWLRPGMHINVVGAPPRPDHREVDSEAIRRSVVVVDNRQIAMRVSGELVAAVHDGVLANDTVLPELGDIIVGQVPGRQDLNEVTLFDSVGLAAQDLAAVRIVLGHHSDMRPIGERASAP